MVSINLGSSCTTKYISPLRRKNPIRNRNCPTAPLLCKKVSREFLKTIFLAFLLLVLIFLSLKLSTFNIEETVELTESIKYDTQKAHSKVVSYATFNTSIAYGSKGDASTTSIRIRDAILNGFRHIVTSGHHNSHNESGVGEGWKMAVESNPSIQRSDLYLQTMFVPWGTSDFKAETDDPKESPETIEEQVHLSLEQSLRNLQTDYIDAVLFNNFRAKLHSFDEMLKAWKVLEEYVKNGTIKQLGIVSVHDGNYIQRLHNESIIKPRIMQNRFHANRQFDVNLRPLMESLSIKVQRFWVLTGNGGGNRNAAMAQRKNVTNAQLMLAFVMSLGDTALVGTKSLLHMRQDIDVSKKYKEIFDTHEDQLEYAKNLGMRLSFT